MEISGRLKKVPSCFMHLLEQEGKGIIIISSIFFPRPKKFCSYCGNPTADRSAEQTQF